MPNELLQSAFPVGTPAELEEAGINPKLNRSCAPENNADGFKGCSYYENCIFANPHGKVAAFRDDGPRNIGWSIHLAEWGKDRAPNEDWGPCYRFMATMWARMMKGRTDEMMSPTKPREDIHIIANEGEVIWLHREVSKVPGSKTQLGTEMQDEAFRIPEHERPSKLVETKGKASEIAKMRELERLKKDKAKSGA